MKKIMKGKKSCKYLSCPICKHGLFTEWAKQVTSQEGVRINSLGKSDYEQAGYNEFSDDYDIIDWVCEKCGVSVRVRFGSKITLHAVPEN